MAAPRKLKHLTPSMEALEAIAACRGAMRSFATGIVYVELGLARHHKAPDEESKGAPVGDDLLHKLEALTTVLAGRLYVQGYVLRRIDLRQLTAEQTENRTWDMRGKLLVAACACTRVCACFREADLFDWGDCDCSGRGGR